MTNSTDREYFEAATTMLDAEQVISELDYTRDLDEDGCDLGSYLSDETETAYHVWQAALAHSAAALAAKDAEIEAKDAEIEALKRALASVPPNESPAMHIANAEIERLKRVVDSADEYQRWRKANPHIKGGENYVVRLRDALAAAEKGAL